MRKFFLAAFLAVALVSQAAEPKVPLPGELKTLARTSLLEFNDAVQAKDFTAFHKQISAMWQEQITAAQLRDAFQTFIDQHIDIASIATVEPNFDPAPTIDSDGVLVVEGEYPTKPSKVTFRLKYVNESDAWKLFGVKLNTLPSGPTDVKLPTDEEAAALVRDSLRLFNYALEKKSFENFYQQIAAVWQKETTPAALQELFQSFIDKKIDLTPVLKLPPEFSKKPVIDKDGILHLEGSYPTKPSTVRFSLGYLSEGGAWKLVDISVNIGQAAEESPNEK